MNSNQIPRTLVISNNCFSFSNANGRTMMNFFRDTNPDRLAQFYLSGEPEPGFCGRYFQISDRDALDAMRPFSWVRKTQRPSADETAANQKRPARNCRNLVLRNLIWKSGRWKSKEFRSFLKDFSPQVVLLQAGDAPFMYRIACQISRQFLAPLVIYNSEGYVLKDLLYASSSASDPWHRILQRTLRRDFRYAMERAVFCVYNTDYLERCYREAYPDGPDSCALYTVSDLQPMPKTENDPFSLLYCGNLGVGRFETLCDIAGVLDQMIPPVFLDIYGSIPPGNDASLLLSHSSVRFHDRVPYAQLPEIMANSTMLLHCENSERVRNLAHAFSTKIADSLASGKPFLVVASSSYPFVQYLQEHRCAHIVSDLNELEDRLLLCRDPNYLWQYRDAALALAAEKHSAVRNTMKMSEILTAAAGA